MFDSQSYQQALNLLHKASTPFGFVAAVQEHDNYKRVWTRDGVITSIAALLSGDKKLIETAKITIETLLNNQHKNGYMPSNVSEDGSVSYGGTSGRADNPSWAVIGLGVYTLLTDDKSLWDKYQPEVSKCFAVLEAWEFNGKHLIYVPQSGDWADEYIQHGYVLFDQLLRLWALRLASKFTQNKSCEDKAAQITSSIQSNYWKADGQPNAYAPNLVHQLKDASSDFWLMGFNPARIYNYFDLQANTFALLLGIGNTSQNDTVANYMLHLHDKRQSLLPSFYPTIEASDADMNDLKNNYAYNFRNKPNFFHNGGLWPVWNGWAVGALKMQGKDELAQSLLKAIHQSNAKDDLFNECFHGKTDKPCGVPNCTWSAAGAIIAEQAMINNDFKKLFKF
ncbi:glycoside hydrolase 100 family protein [Pedobacter jejuensis]|uniref:beta-fructofuranosidase n=1 Tax=Pedobacter jejuensis TaxID=1268550 RepID=A0A3N0BSS7_9SPHI|nr:glycoside hydrolase 100 family protein [Pedobacter jejuensis]RNL52131.1 fructofuranosidase/invertase [Pedobacter jejuensis]